MSNRRDFLLTSLGCALAPGFAQTAAQTSTQSSDDTPEVRFVGGVNVVVVPVTVVDRNGRLVNGLEAKDFQLYDSNKGQEIKVEVTYVPISMVVAIQANNVVEPFLPKIKRLGPLLEGLVLGNQGEAAIVAFDHRIRTMTDGFVSDGKLFTAALNKINPGSSTSAMIDSVFAATRMLAHRPKERKRILLLISESQDKGSEGRLREALLAAEVNNIIVYSININHLVSLLAKKMDAPRPMSMPPAARPMPGGMPQTPTSVDQMTGYHGEAGNTIPLFIEMFKQAKSIFVKDPLDVFTKYTGGREFSFLTEKTFEEVVSKLGEELQSQYIISYVPNEEVRMNGGWHDIKVNVSRPSVKPRYRPGYWIAARPNGA